MLRRLRAKHWLMVALLTYMLADYCGVVMFLQQASYDSAFSYPLEGDVRPLVQQLRRGEKPLVRPVYDHNYFLYKSCSQRCLSEDGSHYLQLRLLFLVKSAARHTQQRHAIRKTWGFERRFSDVAIRTVFLVGHTPHDVSVEADLETESRQHGDIVQGSFVDTYYNNTIKTAMGLRWAVEHCPRSRFYMFVDDDYYVSTRNLLRYLRNPLNYPGYLQQDVISFDEEEMGRQLRQRHLSQLVDFDLPDDVRLFAGHVFSRARPHRYKISKWYIGLDEYPYDFWPPYVTAGAYVLSREALVELYYTSYYTALFRFDDIWLGLIAKKAGLEPLHSTEFHYYPKDHSRVLHYRFVVASHGFSDPHLLTRVWLKQKEAGNA